MITPVGFIQAESGTWHIVDRELNAACNKMGAVSPLRAIEPINTDSGYVCSDCRMHVKTERVSSFVCELCFEQLEPAYIGFHHHTVIAVETETGNETDVETGP